MRIPARLKGEFHQGAKKMQEATVLSRCVVVGKPRILVVEDNLVVQTFIKYQLEALGCEVLVASDASTAIKLYHPSLHLVLLDLDLPDFPGFNVANYIRGHEMGTEHHMPIVGHTSHVDEEVECRCFSVGMNYVVEKLKSNEECLNLLKVWLPEFIEVN